jgi:hypothetical protein
MSKKRSRKEFKPEFEKSPEKSLEICMICLEEFKKER